MNDTIVKALIEAAAIFAQYDKCYSQAQVKSYFEQNKPNTEVSILVKQFEKYFIHYRSLLENHWEPESRSAVILDDLILSFCKQLTFELVKYDRLLFYFSLSELIKGNMPLNSQQADFLLTLATGLKLDAKDTHHLIELMLSNNQEITFNSNFLVISNEPKTIEEELEGAWVDKNKPKDVVSNFTLIRPELSGSIIFLKLSHFPFFVFVYHGESAILCNNLKVIAGKIYLFHTKDRLMFAENEWIDFQTIQTVFKQEGSASRLFLEGKEICTKGNNNKRILPEIRPFSFAEESGNIVCVVGPKATTNQIIKYLSGASMDFEGEISLNKYNYKTELYKIQKLVGLVSTNPIYDSNLTVYQNIYLITKLFYFNSDETIIKKFSEEIIERFHLTEIQDKYLRAKKPGTTYQLYNCLLNLACVSISEPPVLIVDAVLDELSAADADYLMQILKKESSLDRLIFITHTELASSTFSNSDRLWIFDEQGYIIFNGIPKEAYIHFLSYHRKIDDLDEKFLESAFLNPDQITQLIQQRRLETNGVSTLSRKISPEEWYKYFVKKTGVKDPEYGFKKVLPVNNVNTPSITGQFCLFLGKIFKSNVNNFRSCVLFMTISGILAALIGLIFRNDWSGSYYFGLNPNIHLYFITVIAVVFILGFIRGFVDSQREKFTFSYLSYKNISTISYINALLVWLLIYSAVVSIVFTFFGKLILAFHGMFWKYFLVFFSISLLSNILGVLLSIMKRNVYNAYQIFVSVLCFNLLFSGVFIDYHNLPRNLVSTDNVPLLAEFSPFRWAFESLVVDQVKNNNFEKIFYNTDNSIENSYFTANFLIPELQVQLNKVNNLQRPYRDKIIKAIGAEISLFPSIYGNLFPFEYISDLKSGKISPTLLDETQDYLTYTQLQLFDRIRDLAEQRTRLEKRVTDSIGKRNYQRFVLENNNILLKNYLNGSNVVNKVNFNGENFVKSINPIFIQPQSNYGKAPLFAPLKRYNGYYYESLWFNLLVITIFILLLYTLLLMVSQRTGSLIMKN